MNPSLYMHTKPNKNSTHLVKAINESIFTWPKSLCAGGRKREAQKGVEQQPNEHRAEPEKHSPPASTASISSSAAPPRAVRAATAARAAGHQVRRDQREASGAERRGRNPSKNGEQRRRRREKEEEKRRRHGPARLGRSRG